MRAFIITEKDLETLSKPSCTSAESLEIHKRAINRMLGKDKNTFQIDKKYENPKQN